MKEAIRILSCTFFPDSIFELVTASDKRLILSNLSKPNRFTTLAMSGRLSGTKTAKGTEEMKSTVKPLLKYSRAI